MIVATVNKVSHTSIYQTVIGKSSLFYVRFTLQICIIVPTSCGIKSILFHNTASVSIQTNPVPASGDQQRQQVRSKKEDVT